MGQSFILCCFCFLILLVYIQLRCCFGLFVIMVVAAYHKAVVHVIVVVRLVALAVITDIQALVLISSDAGKAKVKQLQSQ